MVNVTYVMALDDNFGLHELDNAANDVDNKGRWHPALLRLVNSVYYLLVLVAALLLVTHRPPLPGVLF